MTVKTFQSLVAGGLRAPTSLTNLDTVIDSKDASDWETDPDYNLLPTAGVGSTTLTDVINITGSGVIQFLGVFAFTAANIIGTKCKIVIDGVTVFDNVLGVQINSTGDEMWQILGYAYFQGTTTHTVATMAYEAVPFYQSLQVQVARSSGSGTPAVVWKRYLT